MSSGCRRAQALSACSLDGDPLGADGPFALALRKKEDERELSSERHQALGRAHVARLVTRQQTNESEHPVHRQRDRYDRAHGGPRGQDQDTRNREHKRSEKTIPRRDDASESASTRPCEAGALRARCVTHVVADDGVCSLEFTLHDAMSAREIHMLRP